MRTTSAVFHSSGNDSSPFINRLSAFAHSLGACERRPLGTDPGIRSRPGALPVRARSAASAISSNETSAAEADGRGGGSRPSRRYASASLPCSEEKDVVDGGNSCSRAANRPSSSRTTVSGGFHSLPRTSWYGFPQGDSSTSAMSKFQCSRLLRLISLRSTLRDSR
jgi:hypothetical protein